MEAKWEVLMRRMWNYKGKCTINIHAHKAQTQIRTRTHTHTVHKLKTTAMLYDSLFPKIEVVN